MAYEDSLQKVQTLVKRLEDGQLPLEDALKAFEEGVRLLQVCQHQLRHAEQRVETLVRENEPEQEAAT